MEYFFFVVLWGIVCGFFVGSGYSCLCFYVLFVVLWYCMVIVIFVVDLMCDFFNRVLVFNLDMDLYGLFCKRLWLELGLLNGSNGINSGYGGGDDCKFFVLFCFYCLGYCGVYV